MLGSRNDSSRSRFGAEPVIIGLFSYASDARRALHVLHEHHFATEQIAAAFREPATTAIGSKGQSSAGRATGKWFGQLRQIYRGGEEGPSITTAKAEPSAPDASTIGFEAMLARIDLSAEDAMTFNRDLDHGAAIVTVRAGTRNEEAQRLLEQRGARILHCRTPTPAEAREPASGVAIQSSAFASPQGADPDHIQLYGEVLRVHKEKISSGDVRVRKEAVTRMETVEIPVTREHLVVEHTDGTGAAGENTLRIPLSEERVLISKDTVLREEYKVGKREVTQQELIRDTVRRERLLIDDASATTKE